jgi:hypothetical protein
MGAAGLAQGTYGKVVDAEERAMGKKKPGGDR